MQRMDRLASRPSRTDAPAEVGDGDHVKLANDSLSPLQNAARRLSPKRSAWTTPTLRRRAQSSAPLRRRACASVSHWAGTSRCVPRRRSFVTRLRGSDEQCSIRHVHERHADTAQLARDPRRLEGGACGQHEASLPHLRRSANLDARSDAANPHQRLQATATQSIRHGAAFSPSCAAAPAVDAARRISSPRPRVAVFRSGPSAASGLWSDRSHFCPRRS